MEGEVQPKFGLMATLLLMNLTAIALFFFATPVPEETSKKQTNNAECVPKSDLVLGDGRTKVKDGSLVIGDDVEGIISSKKMHEAKGPRSSLAQVKTHSGKVEMRVVTPKKTMETSDEPTEPPLAVALKEFVKSTRSGVLLVFEGLKNGYTKRRAPVSSENTGAKRRKTADLEPASSRPSSKGLPTSLQGTKANSPQSTKNLPKERHPVQKQPKPTLKTPEEDGNCLALDVLPSEFVIDAISRAQHRTNELIHVFSKRVVPAIESMNDRIAEAIRLEKNLDSYTSTLISAINSLVCSNTSNVNVKRQTSYPGTSARKPKSAKPFASELSLMRDPRIKDYVGSHSKGEQSSVSKRPVFKTLAARCWHKRRRTSNKVKKHTSKTDEPAQSEVSGELHLKQQSLSSNFGTPNVLDLTATINSEEPGKVIVANDKDDDFPIKAELGGVMELPEPSCLRTIGIEDVLALTSSLEQSSDLGTPAEREQVYQSPLSSDPSMSSGVACRSCVIDPAEPEDACASGTRQLQYPGSAASQSLEPSEDFGQEGASGSALCSDLSIVCDSRVQGYDSLFQNEPGVCGPFNKERSFGALSQVAKEAESHPPSSGNAEKNTTELVNTFQQLDFKQKEVAMESVCLLVMRIFDAWAESQRSSSSLGLSRIALSSWPSMDEFSFQSNRPRTAICRSRIVSGQSLVDGCVPECTQNLDMATSDLDPTSAEISRTLVQNVVEAAEVQIAERSLVGLRTNILRNPLSTIDMPKSSWDSADRSGFGDMNESMTTVHGELAASLMSKSRECLVSKESSAATFYTGQPESSEDAFFECKSTLSAGTCGSHELEIKDSSALFMERIQEEGAGVQKLAMLEPQMAGSSFSIESWLTDSGEELITAKETLNSEGSYFDVGCGTDEDAYPCSSQELSANESESKNMKDLQKKKKWATKLLNKFRKKKPKPSSLPSVALSKNKSRSQSDSVLKPSEQYADVKEC